MKRILISAGLLAFLAFFSFKVKIGKPLVIREKEF